MRTLSRRGEVRGLTTFVRFLGGATDGALLDDWAMAATSTCRAEIRSALVRGLRTVQRRAWAVWRASGWRREAATARWVQATAFADEARRQHLRDALAHARLALQRRALVGTSLRHRADQLGRTLRPRAAWRAWRKALARHAMAVHECRALQRMGEALGRARLVSFLNRWAKITKVVRSAQTYAAATEEAAVERLRVLLADGRKWAERMLVAPV